MQTPLFSIVIPTKNRPTLLDDAIRSCLLQRFDNYEVIVSDNHNDQLTLDVLKRYQDHPNVRVVKPEQELNMLDHWEFATKNATGHYVIILADRNILCQNALRLIEKKIINNNDINCFTFGARVFSELEMKFKTRSSVEQTKKLNTKYLISRFKEKIFYTPESKTKSIHTCYKNSFAKEIRNKYGNYFNIHGVSTPDYSSYFINILLNESIYNIGGNIMISQGSQVSNGGLLLMGDNSYIESIKKSFNTSRLISKLPFTYNLVYNDFIIISKKLKCDTSVYEIKPIHYVENLYYELEVKKQAGLSIETINLLEKNLKDEIVQFGMDEEVIKSIQKRVSLKFEKFNSELNNILSIGHIHLQDFLYARFSEKSVLNKIYPFHYSSILQAAGYKTI